MTRRRSGSAEWRSPTACSSTGRSRGRARSAREDGELKVAAQRKRFSGASDREPAPARAGAACSTPWRSSRRSVVRCPRRSCRSSGPAVVAAMLGSATVVRLLRGSPNVGPAAQELVSGLLSVAPAARRTARLDVAAYHGAEHISIGSYEHGEPRDEGTRALRLAPARRRCLRRPRSATCSPRVLRRTSVGPCGSARSSFAVAASTEIFGWMVRNPEKPARARARQARTRAAAPACDRRADAGADRGRRGRARRVPRARGGVIHGHQSSASRERLPPEIFDLPVDKMREGYYADAYFNHARDDAAAADGRRPRVVMQVFQKKDAYLGGMDEAIAILKLCSHDWDALTVHALYDGDRVEPWETVMTIEGDYTLFAHLETVYLGVARAPHADHDERRARARGRERQADHLHAGPARPPPRADRRRLRGACRRRDRRRADRRDHRRAGVLVGRARDRHRAAFADRLVRRATPCSPRRSSRSGRPTTSTSRCSSTSRTTPSQTALEVARALGPQAVGRAARHLGDARRPLALGRDGRLRADAASTSGSCARCATRSTATGSST